MAHHMISTPAIDPAAAAFRSQYGDNGEGPRSPLNHPRIDDDEAFAGLGDYLDKGLPPGHSSRQPSRQSSYPGSKWSGAPQNADDDEDFKANAAAARKYMKKKDVNNRLDEDDDFELLKPDNQLARKQARGLDEEEDDDEEEGDDDDDEDSLPEHPPGHMEAPPSRKLKGKGKKKKAQKPLFFYQEDKDYYEFTNFAPWPVTYDGKVYPTSEHLFQASKFLEHKPLLAEHIRRGSDRPRFAFTEARKFAPETRSDWMQVNIAKMDEILELKFTQHKPLRRLLVNTGERYLVEDAGKNDAFWGNGADGNGRNELGLALMRLRDKLKKEGTSAPPPGKAKTPSNSKR